MIGSNKEDVALINERLNDVDRYRELNKFFVQAKGNRFIDRFRTFAEWLWMHREWIFRILGLVVIYLDDGTPVVRKAEDVEAEEEAEKEKQKEPNKWPPQTTPDGEPIIDFVDERGYTITENPLIEDKEDNEDA